MPTPVPPRVAILANPTAGLPAGRVSRDKLLETALAILRKRGIEAELFLETEALKMPAAAARLADEGYRCIVAAGGDGTINAVVNGLMQWRADHPQEAKHLRFGILPMGTGNVFAMNVGIPRDWRGACRVIADGVLNEQTRPVDVGLAQSPNPDSPYAPRHFLCMAGVGFDAKVVEETSLRLKFVLRDFAYVLKTLQNVVLHQGSEVTLRFPDGRGAEKISSHQAWLIMIGNAASYAWTIKVTRHARLDDGYLDVCLMPWRNKFVSVQQAMQVLIGQHVQRGVAKYWKTRGVIVESEPNVPVQLDGDEWGHTPVKFSIVPGALRVFAPQEATIPVKETSRVTLSPVTTALPLVAPAATAVATALEKAPEG